MRSDAPPGVTVLAELGRGAQTVVYRVRRDGRDWAMKAFLGSDAAAGAGLRREAAYGENHREIAAALARQGMTAYENALLFAKVERLAVTDGLTGLYNRRHFFQLAARELSLARRRSAPLTATMLDIDHFKQVNDRHGHPVGDQVIVEVARRMEATARRTDVIGRYGGEEFALFLPDTDLDGAVILGERMRAAVVDHAIDTDAGPLRVTVSIGLAAFDVTDTEPGSLLARADDALYRAEEGGRDRVVS